MQSPPNPRFSIVTAVYNVERYLPEFIASIERQTFGLGDVEIIVVDDGSSDDSLRLLQEWAERRPETVRVLSQANAGQGAARNLGMANAVGEWVTFPDPDDVVDDNYLQTVHDFLEANPQADMVAVTRWLWPEATGKLVNRHPLETFFRYDRLVDLNEANGRFHGSSPAAFFRLATIREHDLAYDIRIRPNFEDGHFCSLYLLHSENPKVGFLRSTRYHYRKRDDATSSLGGSMTHPGRYTDVFTYGYRAILDRAEELRGEIPVWLKHFICYEIAGYFQASQNNSVSTVSEGPLTEAFHENVREVLSRVDPEKTLATTEFDVSGLARLITMYGYRDAPWRDEAVYFDRLDAAQGLARARYRYTGPAPTEVVYNGDAVSAPRHSKTRDLVFFGRPLLHERILWVRFKPDARFLIDGEWAKVVFDQQKPIPPTKATPIMVKNFMVRKRRANFDPERYLPKTRPDRVYRRLADTKLTRRKYADAWVFLDRIHDAGDSGEILFKHVRANHPDINAWFVVVKESADYARLKSEGHGDRLVAHGSNQWRMLMANCSHVLSSHADNPVMRPPGILAFHEPTWHFTFLQHGVIKDDLSRWLNYKLIDLFVTSTVPEYASIAGEHTPYPFTTKETILTGLPRFDRLVEIGQRFPVEKRDLVLLTPTWRNWLVASLAAGSQERHLSGSVLESDFVRQWVDLLKDPELARACAEAGLKLAFLPHPNLQKLIEHLDLPDHVTTLFYEGSDVQEYFARARVLVTDYSSIAFNAAYLERPVVYFQFDAEAVLSGAHVGQRGYFDYERDGFGPVTPDRESTVRAIAEAVSHGGAPLPEYQRRIEQTFPHRGGGCSERVVQEVLRALEPDLETEPVPTPQAPVQVDG
ncbi:MAG: glycosyl transferase family 2 [Marmoricola sp.]|nr:glycosyl transferase family 2 [Marmoricola sp.]